MAAVKQHDLGVSATDIARKFGIAEQTLHSWKKHYGGLSTSSRPSNSRPFGPKERQKFTDWMDHKTGSPHKFSSSLLSWT